MRQRSSGFMDYLPFTFPLTDQPDHIALQALFMGFSRGHFSISDRPDGQFLSGFSDHIR